MNFIVDREKKKIFIERKFKSSIDKVWKAWTKSDLLDKWWAPKPWKAKTKIMDFREGGLWLYSMIGPDNSEHWARIDYKNIIDLSSILFSDSFCDSEGNMTSDIPSIPWFNQFYEENDYTTVKNEISFERLEDLEIMINMGFREGYFSALENLDDLLENKIKIDIFSEINADVNKVWDYWTKPEHIINWNFASDDWHCPKAENDLKVGGKYIERMEAKDGSFGFDFEAIYDEINEHKIISYTMLDSRKCTIFFENKENKTNVFISFHAEKENSIELQKSGWQAILDNFKKYVEK